MKAAGERTARSEALLRGLQIDTFAVIVFFVSYASWAALHWHARLTLRDTPHILGAPLLILGIGVAVSVLFLGSIVHVAAGQGRALAWARWGGKPGSPTIAGTALFLIPGITLAICTLATELNARLDTSPPVLHPGAVAKIYTRRGLHGRHCYLLLNDWRVPLRTFSIEVNRSTYKVFETGKLTTVVSHQGFLGYEWISVNV